MRWKTCAPGGLWRTGARDEEAVLSIALEVSVWPKPGMVPVFVRTHSAIVLRWNRIRTNVRPIPSEVFKPQADREFPGGLLQRSTPYESPESPRCRTGIGLPSVVTDGTLIQPIGERQANALPA